MNQSRLGDSEQPASKPIIGVTIGDPAGVGPEIVGKALANPSLRELCRCVIYGQEAAFRRIESALPDGLRLNSCATVEEALAGPSDSVALLEVPAAFPPEIPIGEVSAAGGKAAYAYIRAAVADAVAGRLDAIATAPIHKEAIRAAGIDSIGHTEILCELTQSREAMTLFLVGRLRIFFLTRHVSLRQACELVTFERVAEGIAAAHRYLLRLGLKEPRIAVAALNPHASDGGLMGDEEAVAIEPAIEAARRKGIGVEGPIPADSIFYQAIDGRFDAVIAMYHDQGHIAAKVHDFYGTVSMTLGLPFLRTSVDHGTAMDIAGRGVANETSMLEAIRVAARYAKQWRP